MEQSPEAGPLIRHQLIFYENAKVIQQGKTIFQQTVLEQLAIHIQKGWTAILTLKKTQKFTQDGSQIKCISSNHKTSRKKQTKSSLTLGSQDFSQKNTKAQTISKLITWT